jgi:hypothetical protein
MGGGHAWREACGTVGEEPVREKRKGYFRNISFYGLFLH